MNFIAFFGLSTRKANIFVTLILTGGGGGSGILRTSSLKEYIVGGARLSDKKT